MIKFYQTIGETLHSFKHPSGLRVFVLPKKGFGKSFALFATNFGSINSQFYVDGLKFKVPDGVAHFLEHKLFEEEKGNVFEEFSSLGASANAYTSFDMTGYLFSATANFYESLAVLIRFVQSPFFTDENVEKEKGIIGQEIDMYRDDPSWNCFFNSLTAMYENHPVRLDIAGTKESISKIDKTLLYQCYNAFYVPENMILFIAGDVDPDKVQMIVEENLKNVASPRTEIVLPDEPGKIVKTEIEADFMVSRPMLTLSFKERVMDDPVYAEAVYDILGSLLFGKSSKLYQDLYDANLISDSFSYSYTSGKGYAFMQIDTESDAPKLVREKVLDYIDRIRMDGFDPADFERVKNSTFGASVRMMDDVEKIGHAFVPMAFQGGDFLTYPDVIRNLTLEEVNRVFQNGLSAQNCVLSVINPNLGGEENE